MFETIDAWSQVIRDPFMNAARQAESLPLLFAFLLGIVGALAPCQLSGNISAMTLYGSSSLKKGISWRETGWYTVGKIAAFSLLGTIVVFLGQEFQRQLPLFFQPMRQFLGPLLIFIGIFLLGWLRIPDFLPALKLKKRPGSVGAFLLGFTFSLGFCPTMFILFFTLLMPQAVASPAGFIMPPLFALGTSLPLVLLIFIMWYLDLGRAAVKKSRAVGLFVQKAAGVVLIALGIMDMLTFW
ncbi:sulfite exporter TauE/SafE family protein [Alkalicoccus urumqiensis]|uniref:Cytochrome C biosynthesis protein n=1 Tax=Alkalicoccus urumqiensis TaxID=1548213 RepID=A0A2P6MEH0_ALKUR|nr:sulfite exporter TauE/SafE family protein [Alkalicoccus urumqiensis]PRO64661.1 cytochrome C biosynthesis protein [Alkalicoccus urumqiensis]